MSPEYVCFSNWYTKLNACGLYSHNQVVCFSPVQVAWNTSNIICNTLLACVIYQFHGNKQKLHLLGLNSLGFITTVYYSLFHRTHTNISSSCDCHQTTWSKWTLLSLCKYKEINNNHALCSSQTLFILLYLMDTLNLNAHWHLSQSWYNYSDTVLVI